MKKQSVETIIRALNEASVRYLIAGGLAVVAHGYVRFTADVDLMLDLRVDNVKRALAALSSLGYCPRAPVPIEQFANEEIRRDWVQQKNLTVFSLHSAHHPSTEVDLFVQSPIEFEAAYVRASKLELMPGVCATFVNYPDLVSMKRTAGRPQDLEDIEQLRKMREAADS